MIYSSSVTGCFSVSKSAILAATSLMASFEVTLFMLPPSLSLSYTDSSIPKRSENITWKELKFSNSLSTLNNLKCVTYPQGWRDDVSYEWLV